MQATRVTIRDRLKRGRRPPVSVPPEQMASAWRALAA